MVLIYSNDAVGNYCPSVFKIAKLKILFNRSYEWLVRIIYQIQGWFTLSANLRKFMSRMILN